MFAIPKPTHPTIQPLSWRQSLAISDNLWGPSPVCSVQVLVRFLASGFGFRWAPREKLSRYSPGKPPPDGSRQSSPAFAQVSGADLGVYLGCPPKSRTNSS